MKRPVKPREPLTSADAMMQACGLIGIDTIASALLVDPNRVRQFTNPRGPAFEIPIGRAIEVDLLCREHAGETPFFRLFERRMEGAPRADRERVDLLDALLQAQVVMGRLAAAIGQAIDPNGPGGERITVSETPAILGPARELRRLCDAIEFTCADETASNVTPIAKGAVR